MLGIAGFINIVAYFPKGVVKHLMGQIGKEGATLMVVLFVKLLTMALAKLVSILDLLYNFTVVYCFVSFIFFLSFLFFLS